MPQFKDIGALAAHLRQAAQRLPARLEASVPAIAGIIGEELEGALAQQGGADSVESRLEGRGESWSLHLHLPAAQAARERGEPGQPPQPVIGPALAAVEERVGVVLRDGLEL